MEGMKTFHFFALLVATLSFIRVNGQITTPCTASMISTFTPCLNFITGSTSNGATTPTRSCCDGLKSLTSKSMDCACLLVTASVPLQLPINRTLSLSLPRACKMSGVPVKCKASGTPLPAPGPAALLGPALAPRADSSLSPGASKAVSPATGDLTPASPPAESDAPTTGIKPGLTPPLAPSRSYISLPSFLLSLAGFIIFQIHF